VSRDIGDTCLRTVATAEALADAFAIEQDERHLPALEIVATTRNDRTSVLVPPHADSVMMGQGIGSE
jgi:hypothetical protein